MVLVRWGLGTFWNSLIVKIHDEQGIGALKKVGKLPAWNSTLQMCAKYGFRLDNLLTM